MSTFFRALEQAEEDRELRKQSRPPAETAPSGPSRGPVGADQERRVAPPAEPDSGRPLAVAARREEREAEDSDSWGEVEEHLVSLLHPTSPDAEQYRALRHAVEQLHRSSGLSVLAVSSASVGDGKTTTAINLAGALAQDRDASVLLLDADLRRGAAGAWVGVVDSRERGLVDAILDPSLTLSDVVRPLPFNLAVLPAGRIPSSPYEMLKSSRFGALLDEARRSYDFIVVDTPPMVGAQDCRVIAKWVDGFLLVVAADRTPANLVGEALDRMEPDKIIGFVFNRDARRPAGYHVYDAATVDNGAGEGRWFRAMTRTARQRLSV